MPGASLISYHPSISSKDDIFKAIEILGNKLNECSTTGEIDSDYEDFVRSIKHHCTYKQELIQYLKKSLQQTDAYKEGYLEGRHEGSVDGAAAGLGVLGITVPSIVAVILTAPASIVLSTGFLLLCSLLGAAPLIGATVEGVVGGKISANTKKSYANQLKEKISLYEGNKPHLMFNQNKLAAIREAAVKDLWEKNTLYFN